MKYRKSSRRKKHNGRKKRNFFRKNDKMTLEESYQAFSEGMKLVKMGNDAIDRVEKKIKVLMMEGEEDVEG